MEEIKNVRIVNIKDIIRYSKMSTRKLRRLNIQNGRLYTGKELSREELIYQLTFIRDAPTE
jgi:hypothetical protein